MGDLNPISAIAEKRASLEITASEAFLSSNLNGKSMRMIPPGCRFEFSIRTPRPEKLWNRWCVNSSASSHTAPLWGNIQDLFCRNVDNYHFVVWIFPGVCIEIITLGLAKYGDVGSPELIRSAQGHVLSEVREDAETMIRVGRTDEAFLPSALQLFPLHEADNAFMVHQIASSAEFTGDTGAAITRHFLADGPDLPDKVSIRIR